MWVVVKAILVIAWQVVVQWIKGRGSDQALLKQWEADLAVAKERIATMEAAAAKERAERLKELDEKAAAVTNAHDAAELLRDVTGAPPSPNS